MKDNIHERPRDRDFQYYKRYDRVLSVLVWPTIGYILLKMIRENKKFIYFVMIMLTYGSVSVGQIVFDELIQQKRFTILYCVSNSVVFIICCIVMSCLHFIFHCFSWWWTTKIHFNSKDIKIVFRYQKLSEVAFSWPEINNLMLKKTFQQIWWKIIYYNYRTIYNKRLFLFF